MSRIHSRLANLERCQQTAGRQGPAPALAAAVRALDPSLQRELGERIAKWRQGELGTTDLRHWIQRNLPAEARPAGLAGKAKG